MKNVIRSIVAIATMALLIGTASAWDPDIREISISASERVPTLQSVAPSAQTSLSIPAADDTIIPERIKSESTVIPVNAPKLSDIQGDIPIDLQLAGVNFDGSKPDRTKYDNALATDYLGNPYEIMPGLYLPYWMKKGAVPYHAYDAPTKQSRYAYIHGKAVYQNPDGTTTTLPLALVTDQTKFNIWYKSTYSDPFIVLPTLG